MATTTPWSDDKLDTLLGHLTQRKTVTQIAQAMGLSRGAVSGQIGRLKRSAPDRLEAAGYGAMQARGFRGGEYIRDRARRLMDEFAEHLSEGRSINEASGLIGVTPAHGRMILTRIRKSLGWQAC